MNVQRWGMDYEYEGLVTHPAGKYVTYADHVAALRACEARVRWDTSNTLTAAHLQSEREWADLSRDNYDAGYAAALDAARDAVAALMPGHYSLLDPSTGYNVSIVTDAVRKDEALAAIDALKGEQP